MKAFCASAHSCGVLGSISDVRFRMESGLSFRLGGWDRLVSRGGVKVQFPQNPSSSVSGCLRNTCWGVILQGRSGLEVQMLSGLFRDTLHSSQRLVEQRDVLRAVTLVMPI